MKKAAGLIVAAAIVGVLGLAGYLGVIAWAKYEASKVNLTLLEPGGSTVVYGSDGKPIGRFASAEAGKQLASDKIRPLLRHAHMAAEDRKFYKHNGISEIAMARAAFTNARNATVEAGGSTITQQYAKRGTGDQKNLGRKLNELPYSYRLEREYSKDEILDKYMNANYYGRGAYGIDDAARTWFGVSAESLGNMNDPLQVARAAFLAGLIKEPSRYDDYEKGKKPSQLKYAEEVRGRTRYVLDGYRKIEGVSARVPQKTIDDAKKLLDTPGDLSKLKLTNRVKESGKIEGNPYVMNYIRAWMEEWQVEIAKRDGHGDAEAKREGKRFVEEMLARGGYRIDTTIQPGLQKLLVESHHGELPRREPSAAIVLNPRDGAVVAISGGRDYQADPYNYAVYGKRPPGSMMKAFVLADAVSKDVSVKSVFAAPGTIRIDGPPITDHGGRNVPGCKMTLADSLAVSHNVVAVEAITGQMASCNDRKLTPIKDWPVSVKSVAERIHESGGDASLVPYRDAPADVREAPRLAIGDTLELSPLKAAVMDATLATGVYHKPYIVKSIKAVDGKEPFEHEDESRRVFDQGQVNIINQVLSGVYTKGTARGAQVEGHPLAGKTGTTDARQGDAWIMAHNAVDPKKDKLPAYSCVVWAGKNANRAGADVAEVCEDFFRGALENTPRVNFPKANLNDGKLYGLDVEGDVPPPPPVTTPAAEPTKSEPAPPTGEPTSDNKPKPSDTPRPKPSGTTPSRSIPPPENVGDGTANDAVVPIPTSRN